MLIAKAITTKLPLSTSGKKRNVQMPTPTAPTR